MTYKREVTKALGWSVGAKFISQAVSFVFGIALARLLSPHEFGLIAIVAVFMGFAGLLSDVGLGSALVQKKHAEERHFSAVFWTNMLLGAALACLMFMAAGPIATFYERPEIKEVTRVFSAAFIIGALSMVQRQRLSKELRFKLLVVSDLAGMVIGGAAGVGVALAGGSYWALVVQGMTQQCVSAGIVWACSGWRPRFLFDKLALQELFGFSFYVLANRFLQYTVDSLDKLLVGKYMGSVSVGLLDKAQSMMLFPLQNVSHVIGSVMFPALSKIQDDVDRVRKVYLQATQAISLFAFPMIAGIFATADTFTLGVLGAHWEGIIPLLRVLCVSAFAASIVTLTGSVYLSQGAARLQLRVGMMTKPLTLIALLIGLKWGIIGVAVAAAIVKWINSAVTLQAAGGLIRLGLSDLFLSLLPAFAAATLMGLIVYCLRFLLVGYPPLTVFLIQVAVGVICYSILAVAMRLPAIGSIWEVIKR